MSSTVYSVVSMCTWTVIYCVLRSLQVLLDCHVRIIFLNSGGEHVGFDIS